jgi:hypothetical protein
MDKGTIGKARGGGGITVSLRYNFMFFGGQEGGIFFYNPPPYFPFPLQPGTAETVQEVKNQVREYMERKLEEE